mmetsp:Transcript_33992/g.97922  ORF Transcript_33992/g.97922 Transcript_33992/m.97922 type:complete len:87 (-) Transcript_33992:2245-2505(-)
MSIQDIMSSRLVVPGAGAGVVVTERWVDFMDVVQRQIDLLNWRGRGAPTASSASEHHPFREFCLSACPSAHHTVSPYSSGAPCRMP